MHKRVPNQLGDHYIDENIASGGCEQKLISIGHYAREMLSLLSL